jgi:uncharacterized phage protein gp47/JayE
MTFVAQPYERFVDDLLTALTGGMIREEHRFTGIEESYSLGAPGVLPGSIKVFGQRNDEFVTFDPRTDWAYDTGLEAIVWRTGGRLPDPDSYFYTNYDLRDADRRVTDRNPGSVTTTLAEALAREFAILHKQMEMIYRSGFVDLADSSSLDHVVALLGLTRKDARFASGEVLFTRSTPASGDIAIPAGTLVSTAQGINFETSEKRTLRYGQLSVVAPVRAQVEGPEGRVDAGAIISINRPIFGIESVSNERATFFATEKETDEQLRARVKASLERAGKATVDAIKFALIERADEITEENIEVRERADAPGFVDVRLGLESAGDPNLVRRIEEAIFDARPAGVRVIHNLPTSTPSVPTQQATEETADIPRPTALADFRAAGEPVDAYAFTPDELATQPEGILNLRIEVLLRLAESNLSAAQKEEVEDDVRARVIAYIEALPMGAPLIYNKLLGRVIQPDVVADARMLVGLNTSGAFNGLRQNLLITGRKATLGIYDVFVGLMEEIVPLEIAALVEPAPSVSLSPEARVGLLETLNEGGVVHRAVTIALENLLAAAQGSIRRSDLHAAVTAELARLSPPLILVEGDQAFTLNATYVETGRLLNNTEHVALAEYETPHLMRLAVHMPGGLDVQS